MADDGSTELERAWDGAAQGYAAYFSPRFQPWIDELLATALAAELVAGPIVVACCGPGVEVARLAEAWPERRVVAIDLSTRMIALTRERCAALANVEAHAADATSLREARAPAALVVSCFGLQQMPDPPGVATAWTRALAPRGSAHVLFWPSGSDAGGPMALAKEIAAGRLGLPQPSSAWEGALAGAIEVAGGRLLSDALIAHDMEHASAGALWDEMTEAGPWRPWRLRYGDESLAEVRRAFVERAAAGAIRHRLRARLLCFTR